MYFMLNNLLISTNNVYSKASAPAPPAVPYPQYNTSPSYPSGPPQPQPQTQNVQNPQQIRTTQEPQPNQEVVKPIPQPVQNRLPHGQSQRNNSVHTAATSLETVERALVDLRVSNGTSGVGVGNGPLARQAANHGHGRRGHQFPRGQAHSDIKAGEINVPTEDFDFQSSNARFDKAALAQQRKPSSDGAEKAPEDEVADPSGNEDEAQTKVKVDKEKDKDKEAAAVAAYNPHKSFFDSLSSSSHIPAGKGGAGDGAVPGARGGRRGGPGGRNRREEERERNVATFGEPGGVGLLGPGQLVFIHVNFFDRIKYFRRLCWWVGRLWEKGYSS
jgi:protein LSM14